MRALVVVALLVPSSVAVAQPVYAPTTEYREGLTIEGNAGLGLLWLTFEDSESDQELAFGFGGGIGAWLSPQLAITGRLGNVIYADNCSQMSNDSCALSSTVIGPSAQFWLNDQVWIGGGVGLAILRTYRNDSNEPTFEDEGFGLDLRAGFSFAPHSQGSLNLSIEYAPAFYTQTIRSPIITFETDYTVHGFVIALGYL